MAVIKRATLVERGSEQLDEAKKMLNNGSGYSEELELIDRKIAIANAYARIADALGDSHFTEVTARNW